MKQIVNNKYVKEYKFSSKKELSAFIEKQTVDKTLFIDDFFGEYYYTYIGINALTQEKEFIITFNSDENSDNLNFLFWEEQSMYVIDTGGFVYLINYFMKIKYSTKIFSTLIGMYVVNNKLLLLEEDGLKLISNEGLVLLTRMFDLINNFAIKEDLLFIKTEEGEFVIKLD